MDLFDIEKVCVLVKEIYYWSLLVQFYRYNFSDVTFLHGITSKIQDADIPKTLANQVGHHMNKNCSLRIVIKKKSFLLFIKGRVIFLYGGILYLNLLLKYLKAINNAYFLVYFAGILKLYEDILIHQEFILLAQFLTKLPENISSDSLFKSIELINMNIDKKKFSQILASKKEQGKTEMT